MRLPRIKWKKLTIYGVLGMGLGFAYYYFIGCSSGTCPITSNPFISTGYGLGAGVLLGWDIEKTRDEENG